MNTINYKKDSLIYKAGESMQELGLIVKGSVRQETKETTLLWEAGHLIGLAGCDTCVYAADYYAHSDVTIYRFPYSTTDDMMEILTKQEEYGSVFILATLKQTRVLLEEYVRLYEVAKKLYMVATESGRVYKFLCSKYGIPEQIFARMDFLAPLEERQVVEQWKTEYYSQFVKFQLNDLKELFTTRQLCIGTILQTSEFMRKLLKATDEINEYVQMHKTLLFAPNKNDLYQLMFDLEVKVALVGKGRQDVVDAIGKIVKFANESRIYNGDEVAKRKLEYETYDFVNIQEDGALSEGNVPGADLEDGNEIHLGSSLEQILRFAEDTPEHMIELREKIAELRELNDPYSTDESVRRLRKNISTAFYRVYKNCVKRVLLRGETTRVVDMFLNFGYMDVTILGEEKALQLEKLLDKLYLCKSEKVYTFFTWLESIYHGEHEPSISELDMDYGAYLKEAVKNGNMTAEEAEKNKDNRWMRVEYELDNMFQSLGKTLSGKITTFCPVLKEDDLISSPERMLVTAEQISNALNQVRAVDYSVFYREVMYSDESHGLAREYINKEILPDVILFPIAGSRGMLWQVTEGVRNNTAGRIMLPIFATADVEDMIIENCGRFRWEMCRKVQGSRWNDITTPSLTAEYNDYIQYYKKNADLSTEAKEKVANALLRARNNFREVFVKDYESWIKFEAKGSFRLNKVARALLFTYCPFSANLRENVKDTPMFADLVRKYNIATVKKVKRLEALYQRLEKSGGEITAELKENLEFYEK